MGDAAAVRGVHPMADGAPPSWATLWGEDRYGVFAGFVVGEVEVRMRWVEGGVFVMGSPESEAGRYHDETQHEVELSSFWLGEVPVTQALWQAVMGENPSVFVGDDRPVEQVSWNLCESFYRKLNDLVPGANVEFPTEAQWEYACRAGTTTATYNGDLTVLGENHAPELHRIAWYGGNSGLGFELPNGWDSSDWTETQFEQKRAGTHPVGRKRPNELGLYDMLGNVYEWCADWSGPYPKKRTKDPTGPPSGDDRVLRGGSWRTSARRVRAAFRGADVPGLRVSVGLRLARGQ